MTNLSDKDQIDFIRELRDLYYEHMEGEDYPGFIYWETLMSAAQTILNAMERPNKWAATTPK